jgi:signal transduction histidine kinase
MSDSRMKLLLFLAIFVVCAVPITAAFYLADDALQRSLNLGFNPQVVRSLDTGVRNLKTLKRMDPANALEYRAEFEETQSLMQVYAQPQWVKSRILASLKIYFGVGLLAAVLASLSVAALLGRRISQSYQTTFNDLLAHRERVRYLEEMSSWQEMAKALAHEIKNPLTPIQLAAERLKRRFTKEITSDPDTFSQCADTIIRHVGDIGRMVDEFSAFARMPQPVIRPENLAQIVRETLILQRTALPRIAWSSDIPDRGPVVPCDRRMVRQALTNLLRNAADAIAMRPNEDGGPGSIAVKVAESNGLVSVQVTDDGIGLPREDRARLTEPYVTHKPKGTGLGLAIVKKIMEDHRGQVTLDDRPDGPGTVAALVWPSAVALPDVTGGKTASGPAGELVHAGIEPEGDRNSSPGFHSAGTTHGA